MKIKILFSLVIYLLPFGVANAQMHNMVQTDVVKVSGITTDVQLFNLNSTQRQTSRVYMDGLDRPIQSIAVNASPNQHDMIGLMVYDSLGRQSIGYLPYTANSGSGSYRSAALTEQASFYNGGMNSTIARDTKPWAQQLFENSPMQRVYKAGSVGDGFQPTQHYKSMDYRTNTLTDSVRLWLPDGSSSAYYGASLLNVTAATDEQGIQGMTFTNDNGQLVLKRQQGPGSTWLDTYYIYNDAGQPIYVIPPKAVVLMKSRGFGISTTGVDKLLFKMTYDTRGRLTVKKVPSAGEMYVVYDPLNRPVLMQDANLRALNKWNYIKYDVKGRAIAQGIYVDATHTTLSSMQSYVDGMATTYQTTYFETRTTSNTYWYYTNTVFPTSGIEPLAYSYYDDYHISNGFYADYSYSAQGLSGEGTADTLVNGMLTAVRKRTVGTGLAASWLISVTFYDSKGRAIQTQSNNHLYATVADKATVVTDFVGKPTITKVTKNKSGSISTTVQTAYTYDHADRVTAIDQGYNGGTAKRIANYVYNELGQLMKKNLGRLNSGTSYPYYITLDTTNRVSSGTIIKTAQNRITIIHGFKATATTGSLFKAEIKTDYLQALDYRYNIRGQLLTMNNSTLTRDTSNNDDSNDVFGMQMLYDQTDSGIGNTAYYNSRLSAVKWMSRAANGQKTAEKSYKYAYDPVNRLTDALYSEKATGGSWTATGAFDEKGVTYDANGNILTLTRFGLVSGVVKKIDSLKYHYNPDDNNKLKWVNDGSSSVFKDNGFKNLANNTDTTQYDYDDNGNLIKDLKKGITQHYNILNRVDSIRVTAGTNQWVTYTYDATGKLLRKKQYKTSSTVPVMVTDYIDGFVFENDTLRYFAAAEGRVRVNGATLINEYVITDTQGNSRVSFEDSGSGVAVVRQENSYYPFGLIMSNGITPPTQPNKQLYNGGSEWQNDYGNDLPDYYQTFYRNYDAAIGRFVGVDSQADAADSWTPYQYALNNPGMLNDPMGDLATGRPIFPDYTNGMYGSAENSPVMGKFQQSYGYSNDDLANVDNFHTLIERERLDNFTSQLDILRNYFGVANSSNGLVRYYDLSGELDDILESNLPGNSSRQNFRVGDHNEYRTISEDGPNAANPFWVDADRQIAKGVDLAVPIANLAEFIFVGEIVDVGLAASGIYRLIGNGVTKIAGKYVSNVISKYAQKAAAEAILSAAQNRAVVAGKVSYQTMKGSVVDGMVKDAVSNNFLLKQFVDITPRFKFGPDFVGKGVLRDVWVDVTTTTPGIWERHVVKYSQFGQGIPVLY